MNSLSLIYKVIYSIYFVIIFLIGFLDVSSRKSASKPARQPIPAYIRYVTQIGPSSIIYGAIKAPTRAAIDPIDVPIVL